MIPFFGGRTVNLDDKSRLPIPSDLRDLIPEDVKKLAIIKGLDGCLFVYPANDIRQLASRFQASRFLSQKAAREFQRKLFEGASVVELDAQGRVALNSEQLAHAGLERKAPAKVVGNLDRIEIWHLDRYAGQVKVNENDPTLDELAEKFFAQDTEG